MSILPIRRISAAARSLLTLRFSATRRATGGKVTALLACALLCFGALPAAHAATINVDSGCTLAQAITSANTDSAPTGSTCEDGSGADTISLSANVSLSADLTSVSSNITVSGGGYTIDGADTYHMFYVLDTGTLTVSNVTLANSKANNRTSFNGGAVYTSKGTVTVTNSRITSSTSTNGGGLYVDSTGTATISNSTFDNNAASASGAGGGLVFANGATATVSHVTLYNNSGALGSTLYLHITNNVKLRNTIISDSDTNLDCEFASSTFSENVGNLIDDNTCSPASSDDPKLGTLTGSPGYYPIASDSAAVGLGNDTVCAAFSTDQAGSSRASTSCDAGAVEYVAPPTATPTPTPTVTNTPTQTPTATITPTSAPVNIIVDSGCTLAQAITSANTDATAPNSTCEAGSGADTITLSANVDLSALLPAVGSDITFDGKNYTIDGRNSRRIFDITSGTVTVKDAVLTKGNAGGAHGGNIRARGANLTLTRVTLSNGESKNNGGGLFFDGSSKRLTITSSTIANNQTKDNSGGLGGGIYVRAQSATIRRSAIGSNTGYSHGGGIYNDGTLTIENSTIYSNQSSNGHGGGVYTNSGDTTTLKHVTLNGNSVSSSGDGDSIYRGGTTNLYNSILAGTDTSAHCEGSGTLNQAGSLIQDNSCSPAVSGDPSLGR